MASLADLVKAQALAAPSPAPASGSVPSSLAQVLQAVQAANPSPPPTSAPVAVPSSATAMPPSDVPSLVQALMAANPSSDIPAYFRMKQSGEWNLADPNSPTWQYLNSLVNADVKNDPSALVEALHMAGVGSGVGQNKAAYEAELRTALSGLPPQFIDSFVPTAGERIQQYWNTLPDDSITPGSVLKDVGSGVVEFGKELAPLALGGLATYFGVQGLGGLLGGGEAAAALGGATAAPGTVGGAEGFLGSGLSAGSSASGIGGGALGTGLSPGVSASGIGGGALGTGIGGGVGGSSGLAAAGAAGLGSLGSNFFAGESLAPVIGGSSGTLTAGGAPIGSASAGGTAATTAAGGGTAPAANSGALERILNGSATTADWLSLGGAVLPSALSMIGLNQQSNALEGIARQQQAADQARYEDLVRREQARYQDVVGREDTRLADLIAREQARFDTVSGRDDARLADLIAREQTRFQDVNALNAASQADLIAREQARYEDVNRQGQANLADLISREQARFDTLQGREDAAIARQRGDIEFGRAVGAPYRDQLAALYADPSSFLNSPAITAAIDQGTNSLARALSVKGNPAGNPAALAEIQKYASNNLAGLLGQEKDRLAAFGGLSAFNQSGASIPGIGTNLSGAVPGAGSVFGGSVPGMGNVFAGGVPGGGNVFAGSVPSPGQLFSGSPGAGSGISTSGGLGALLGSAQASAQQWGDFGRGLGGLMSLV